MQRAAKFCGSVVALGAAAVAFAQAQPAERVEVTGSHLRRIDYEPPAPLTVIGRDEIERSGARTTMEVVLRLPYSGAGSVTESLDQRGVAYASLRGLGAEATLVLLNGRRVANFAQPSVTGAHFVDLNAIPASAIDRIEVLRDGASAIYGSDAIAGVVNLVLRRDYRGAEATVGYGQASRGDAEELRAHAMLGAGDFAADRFNVLANVEWLRRELLLLGDRPPGTSDFRRLGLQDRRGAVGSPGTWLTAGRGGYTVNTVFPDCPPESRDQQVDLLGTCAFNGWPWSSYTPETDRKSAYLRGVWSIARAASAFAELGHGASVSGDRSAPTAITVTLPVGHNSNPFGFAVPVRYRFLDVGAHDSRAKSITTRWVAGLGGESREWTWETAWVEAKHRLERRSTNHVTFAQRDALVLADRYDFVHPERNEPALAEGLRTTLESTSRSRLRGLDAKLAGTVARVGGNDVGLAVGAEGRREEVADPGDRRCVERLVVGVTCTSSSGSRSVRAAYAELSVPVPRVFEAQLALRHEEHSDYGSSTSPKVAMSLRPVPWLMVRGGYNEGFRAPSLGQLYAATITADVGLRDFARCAAYTSAFGASDNRTRAACSLQSVPQTTGGNPRLGAETSRMAQAGLTVDSGRGLVASLDAYRIREFGRIDQPLTSTLLENEASFPGAIVRAARTADDLAASAPGAITGLNRVFFNYASLETRGIDLELKWVLPDGAGGRLTLASMNAYLDRYRVRTLPGSGPIDLVGADGEHPRYRGQHSASWQRGAWEVTISANVTGAGRGFPLADGTQPHTPSWTTWDLTARYTGVRDVTVSAGVTNLFDRMGPVWMSDGVGPFSLLGRFFHVRVGYRFG